MVCLFWQKYLTLCNSVRKSPNLVASEIGVKSSGTVTGWKNGALPRENVLIKMAEYFEVPLSELTESINKNSSAPEGTELIPGYSDLSDEEKKKVSDYIDLLLAARRKE